MAGALHKQTPASVHRQGGVRESGMAVFNGTAPPRGERTGCASFKPRDPSEKCRAALSEHNHNLNK